MREGADSKNVDRGEFRFTIRAKNKHGELKTEGGDEFNVKIEGPNGVDVPVTTKDHGDGHYSATYKLVAPREDGDTDPQVPYINTILYLLRLYVRTLYF